jgi:hypothetical protein
MIPLLQPVASQRLDHNIKQQTQKMPPPPNKKRSASAMIPETPASSAAGFAGATDVLCQCLRAFTEWHDALDPHAYGNQGNIVAVPAIDGESNSIRVDSIEKIVQSQINNQLYLGVRAKKDKLVHGSVVGLYSYARKAFLDMTKGVVSPKPSPSCAQLTTGIQSKGALFLVIDLGYDYFAFCSIDNGQFLGINPSYEVHGMWSSSDLSIGSTCDVDVIESIPEDAVFWVRSERSDGSTISLYSPARQRFLRLSPKGFFDAESDTPGDLESYQPVLVMDAAGVGGLNETSTWIPRSRSARKFAIQRSVRAFSIWKDNLASSDVHWDGNVVAVAKEDPTSNGIAISEAVHKTPAPPTSIHLGEVADVESISHCNVIALHCAEHNSFLVHNVGQICAAGPRSATDIPADSRRSLFLVIELGDHQFAFYHIDCNRFLVAMAPDKIVALPAKTPLELPKVSDETIIDQLPEGAVFVVRPERSNGTVVSLKSQRFQTYLTLNADKTVSAVATSAGPSQQFQVVLLMDTKLLRV